MLMTAFDDSGMFKKLKPLVSKEFFDGVHDSCDSLLKYDDSRGMAISYVKCITSLLEVGYSEEDVNKLDFGNAYDFYLYYEYFDSIDQFIEVCKSGKYSTISDYVEAMTEKEKYGDSIVSILNDLSDFDKRFVKYNMEKFSYLPCNLVALTFIEDLSLGFCKGNLLSHCFRLKLNKCLPGAIVSGLKVEQTLEGMNDNRVWWILLSVAGEFSLVPFYEFIKQNYYDNLIKSVGLCTIKFFVSQGIIILILYHDDSELPKFDKGIFNIVVSNRINGKSLDPIADFMKEYGKEISVYPYNWMEPIKLLEGLVKQ